MDELARSVAARFSTRCGRDAEVIVRAPGRVNLIGEHTDYSLLPVLPVAIDRCVVIAGAALDRPRCEVTSLQQSPPALLPREGGTPAAPWHRYLLGVLAELTDLAPSSGAQLLVGGNLPLTGGLSSSSALTMGLLFALDQLWGGKLPGDELIERGVRAERRVGLEGGAMDQTVITMAHAGAALRIDFRPPGRRLVRLPPELRLLVAYSGRPAPKGTTAQAAYNRRVVACRLAALLLGSTTGSLGEVAPSVTDAEISRLPQRASVADVACQVGPPSVADLLLVESLDRDLPLRIRAAARHVLSEAQRVDAAEHALAANDLPGFGSLLDASHRSLRDDYHCSTPQLDRLCAALRGAGALGARLTGAGFGGWAMAAARRSDLPDVLAAARRQNPDAASSFEVEAATGLQRWFWSAGATLLADRVGG